MSASRDTVIVTGGSSGIGLAISRRLLSQGYAVIATGRKPGHFENKADAAEPYFRYVSGDHSLEQTPYRVVETYQNIRGQYFGPLVGLVNNVGRRHNDLIPDHTLERLTNLLTLNVSATILMTSVVVPLLHENGGGSIVNISSRLAVAGMRGVSGYAASKAAINGFTVSAAAELAPQNIRVNAVAPGMTKTPLIEAWLSEQSDPLSAERDQASKIPLERLCAEEDVAHAVAYLLGEGASYVTGSVLPVDGGYTAV